MELNVSQTGKFWFVFLTIVVISFSIQHYDRRVSTDNEYIRWEATLAWCDQHTPYLDPVFDRLPFGNWRHRRIPPNRDAAYKNGHYFLDKAPMLSLAGCIIHPVLGLLVDSYKRGWIEVQAFTFILITIPLLIFLYLAFNKLSYQQLEQNDLALAMLIFALGTPFLLYSTTFFGALPAGVLVFTGYELWKRHKINGLISGVITALSVLTEFTAFPAVLAVAIYVVFTRSSLKRKAFFITGLTIPALLLLLYNTYMFGGPFNFSYHYKVLPEFSKIISTGMFGFTLPSVTRMVMLLFSPQRGLFFLSPIVLILVVSVFFNKTHIKDPDIFVSMLVLSLQVIIMSGFVDWKAGRAAGPRHLIPAIPFFIYSFQVYFKEISNSTALKKSITLIFGLISIIQVVLIHQTNFYLSQHIINPIYHEVIPLFLSHCGYYLTFSSNSELAHNFLLLMLIFISIELIILLKPSIKNTTMSITIVAIIILGLNMVGRIDRHTINEIKGDIYYFRCSIKRPALWWLGLSRLISSHQPEDHAYQHHDHVLCLNKNLHISRFKQLQHPDFKRDFNNFTLNSLNQGFSFLKSALWGHLQNQTIHKIETGYTVYKRQVLHQGGLQRPQSMEDWLQPV